MSARFAYLARFLVLALASPCACQNRVAPSADASPLEARPSFQPPAAPKPLDPFAFEPRLFERKRPFQPGDWLVDHPESGQTFDQYVVSRPVGLTERRTILVLQPLGPFTGAELARLPKLRDFTAAFFQLPVRVEPATALPRTARHRTRNEEGRTFTQYETTFLLQKVLRPRLPDDAVAYLGITMSDLYPEESWNYVFGEGSLQDRVGVYSLTRYTESFFGRPETPASEARFLRRAFKVLAHETGHDLSLAHCTAYECLMNGSNSLDELDANRIHLCPVCLHKLAWALHFDVAERYRQLGALYAREGLGDWSDWVLARRAMLAAPTTGAPP